MLTSVQFDIAAVTGRRRDIRHLVRPAPATFQQPVAARPETIFRTQISSFGEYSISAEALRNRSRALPRQDV
jgi:hypothetical protein